MITFRGAMNGGYEGDCLSKDIPNLPKTGIHAQNGTNVFVMDTPDGTNATSKLYKFDEENKVWIAQ